MQSENQTMLTAMYSSKKFREATTKEEQCKVPLQGWEEYDGRRKEYQKYCRKSKSNNIVLCPKKIIRREKDKKVQWINDYFKSLGKRSKKEKAKKKGKEKRKKKEKDKLFKESQKLTEEREVLERQATGLEAELKRAKNSLKDLKGEVSRLHAEFS